jgi:integrase
MPRLTRKLPSYRLHKPSGQALVTLNGRDRYLGPWNSPESRAEYDRLIAEWLAAGRGTVKAQEAPDPGDPTVVEVLAAFMRHAERHYAAEPGERSDELKNMKDAVRPLRTLYGRTPARSFGPLALRAVRDEMIKSGLARTTVNARINRVRRVFKWAASVEMVPASVVESLRTLDGLREGRTSAREPDPIEAVPIEVVDATLPFLPRPVAAMVRVQLLCGCRAGEVVRMRGCDLALGEPVWEYRPSHHKNRWRGKGRVIPLGPRAQAIVRDFLKPDLADYLFSPAAAVTELHDGRRAGRLSKPTPSELARRCAGGPGLRHSLRYSTNTYRQAIVRACRKAGVPQWSPLQLRHTAATMIRARYGLEAAQTILGHAKPDTTLIYAERDEAKARAIMKEVG